jgi:hypothetical protein
MYLIKFAYQHVQTKQLEFNRIEATILFFLTKGLVKSQLRFQFDGNPVNDDDTPESVSTRTDDKQS